MKKRILALILCVLMVLPVFAGCAKTEAEKSKNADEEICVSDCTKVLCEGCDDWGGQGIRIKKQLL